ncbi:MAG TPA: sugar transferase [Anaerolineales bacterium]|nr:sugar transferase [Anaerolineales bacterium]
MFRRYSLNYTIFSMGLDALMVMLALAIADALRPAMSSFAFIKEVEEPSVPLILYPIFALIWVLVLTTLSVYDGRRNLYATDEFSRLTLGSILAAISLAGLLYLSYREISRILFIFFALQVYIYMLAWRLAARLGVFANKNGNNFRNVLIIGAGNVGEDLRTEICQNPYLGLRVVGFVDDDVQKQAANSLVLGPLAQTREIVRTRQVDDVVIALPLRAYAAVSKLTAELHDLPVKVWIIPDYFHLALHKAQISEFAGLPMLDLRAPALKDYQRLGKRIFDLVMGSVFLLLFSPLMLVIAIAIKRDSPGPVIYRSLRMGENGRLFSMYKFRSMIQDADKQLEIVARYGPNGEILHKSPDDPRITRVGRLLRKTSLDELPQLFNVIKGEMSLVGPRPEIPALVKNYEPWQRKRFSVPQGITGWWQINGRSDKPMHLHTEDDIYYIQNYSIFLDIFILLKTVWAVLRGDGAY